MKPTAEPEVAVVPHHPLADCAVCPLYKADEGYVQTGKARRRVARSCVHGAGPAQADIVLVGEAPGENETKVGRPFVGESGQLLERAFREIGLDRSRVYVTNAALCRPTKNGQNVPPPASAIKACRLRLLKEVQERRPRVVVVLGNTALRAVGIAENISSTRGRERWITAADLSDVLTKGASKKGMSVPTWLGHYRDGGFYALPTFHPAFVLRTTDAYPDLVRDLKRAMELTQAPPAQVREVPTPIVHVPTDVEDAVRWLARLSVLKARRISADIESSSRYVMKDELLTLAYGWKEGKEYHALVIPARDYPEAGVVGLAHDPRVRFGLRRLHKRRDTRFVWWNGKFDRKWYRHHLGVRARIDGDGMLAHVALDTRRGIHGLKGRASDDLGADDYENEIKGYVGVGSNVDYGKIPWDKLVSYTAADVCMTLILTRQYEMELREDADANHVYRHILLRVSPVLSDIELEGVQIDRRALRKLRSRFTNVKATGMLDRYLDTLRKATAIPWFNPNSYAHKIQLLYGPEVAEQFGVGGRKKAAVIPTFRLPVMYNDKKTPGTGAEQCDKLLRLPTLTGRERKALGAIKLYSLDGQLFKTYIKKLPRALDPDGRIRANFNQHTVRTLRLSSSDPINLQNIPVRRKEGKWIKNAFMAREGWLMWEVDLSQAELRMAAFLSNDPVMRQIYLDGRDYHHEVGTLLLGSEDLARELREFIKTFNFARLYGAGDNKLTVLLNDSAMEREARERKPQKRWSVKEVGELSATFRSKFPTFNRWAEEQKRHAYEFGWVTSHFRCKRVWPLITRDTLEDVYKEAVNHPVQNGAAQLLNMGMIDVHKYLRKREGRLILTVHDSLAGESPAAQALDDAREAKRLLEAVAPRYGIDLPFLADIKIGQRWGELEKHKEAE